MLIVIKEGYLIEFLSNISVVKLLKNKKLNSIIKSNYKCNRRLLYLGVIKRKM